MNLPMAWIPNGAYRFGSLGSRKSPRRCTRRKCELNTSTLPSWKFEAYRNVPAGVLAIVSPLYTAVRELHSSVAVEVPVPIRSATGFHALIWPDSEEKMNRAGPLPDLEVTTKPVVG